MASPREYLTKWGFDIDSKPLDNVEKRLEKIQNRLEFIAAGEILKGIFELAEKFGKIGEELSVAAASAGVTTEAFQKLAFAANKSNISSEEMGMSMARLARHIYDARRGGEESVKAFAQAGFSAAQIQGFHTSADAMRALADRFRAIQDPIQKQALAMQLLGRGSVNMVAFLSQGSGAIKEMGDEAERFGAILSGAQVQALVKLEHALSTLWAVIKGVSGTIAAQFAPSLETAIDKFLHFYEINRKLIEVNIKQWVWDITYAMGFIFAVIEKVTQAVFNWAAAHPLLARRISEVGVALLGLALTVLGLTKGFELLKDTLGLLGLAFKPLSIGAELGFKPIIWLAGLLKNGLVWLLLKMAVMAETALPALSTAFLWLGGVIEATPIGWFITAIAALIVIVHDLYQVLFNGKSFKDTWIGQAFDFAKGAVGKIGAFFGIGGDEGADKKAGGGTGVNAIGNIVEKVQSVKSVVNTDISRFLPTFGAPGVGGPSTENNSQINAPMTFNIAGNPDPNMIGQKVKEGIKDHLDTLHRNTKRAVTPAVAY